MFILLLLSSIMYAPTFIQGDVEGPSTEPIPEISDLPPTRDDGPIGLYDGRILYDDVVLIVNDNSDISREIGTYFAERRNLPPENIINISTSTSETITAAQFDEVAAAIKANLTDRGIADSINYLVTTKGVPLRVSGATNARASFDSELALVGGDFESSIHASPWLNNPYYRDMDSFSFERVGMRLVTRLTGYTVEEAKHLVDLAEISYGSRGNALMDLDPGKDGSPGYKIGNDWMRGADTWFKQNGYPSLLDENRTFRTGFTDLMAYNSWGSNDGNWSYNHISNSGFDYGTGDQASSWTYVTAGGNVTRNGTVSYSGDWSLKLERNGSGSLLAYQDRVLPFIDHRYILEGRMKLEGVSSQGVKIWMEGLDDGDGVVTTVNLRTYSGTRDWTFTQGRMENDTSIVKVRTYVELLGDGVVHFDAMRLRVIRPHNTWVPGGLAETCVSTGGRSFNYGATYGQSLIADLIRDGVTGVKGYVYEPYLSAISHADVLFPDYYSGANLAESYYAGSQFASWMGVMVGDPKCAPFIDLRPDPRIADEPYTYWIDEEGQPRLMVHIANDADVEAGAFDVAIYIDGEIYHSGHVAITPGGSFSILVDLGRYGMISGVNELSIVINSNSMIRDHNESNNRYDGIIIINTIPEIDLFVGSPEVNRTSSIELVINVDDVDELAVPAGANLTMIGPDEVVYVPTFDDVSGTAADANLTYLFTVPWDAPIGFYDVSLSYKDTNGSWDEMHVERALLVLNNAPCMNGSLSHDEIERGGTFTVDLEWSDVDTPDGSLTLLLEVEGSMMGPIDPYSTSIGSHNGTYDYMVPPAMDSQDISIEAKVYDRDGSYATWETSLSTFNKPPNGTIKGGPFNVSRLDEASYTLIYSDPEGQPTRSAQVSLWGPKGKETEAVAETHRLSLEHLEEYGLTINCSELELGVYDLIFTYEDDEWADGLLTMEDALTVHNILPAIGDTALEYLLSDVEIGSDILRGDEVTVRVAVEDLDSPGFGLYLDGALIGPDGEALRDLTFSKRGSSLFEFDLRTDMNWPFGRYSLELTLTDDQMGTDHVVIEDIFALYNEAPDVSHVSVSLEEDGSVLVELLISSGAGGSLPESVTVELSDGNGTIVQIDLISVGALLWYQSTEVERLPTGISLILKDDQGRVQYWNESVELNTSEPDVDDDPPAEVKEESSSTSMMIALILIALLVIAVIGFFILYMVTSRKSSSRPPIMMAPPPMPPGILSGDHPSQLPALDQEGQTDLMTDGGPSPEELPPAGSEPPVDGGAPVEQAPADVEAAPPDDAQAPPVVGEAAPSLEPAEEPIPEGPPAVSGDPAAPLGEAKAFDQTDP